MALISAKELIAQAVPALKAAVQQAVQEEFRAQLKRQLEDGDITRQEYERRMEQVGKLVN